MTDLAQIADELYALTPNEFVAARNDRVKALRADKLLSRQVRDLPKPSAAAWATNLLARQRPEQVSELIALGQALREAQDDLDRNGLRQLGTQRRALVSALAKQAGAIAQQLGQPVSSAATIEVEHTLNAAMGDPDAAAAVSSGRLVRALSSDGLEAVDLDGAVGGPLKGVPAAPPRAKVDAASAESKRAVAEAREALAEAEREAEQAAERLGDAERRIAAAERENDGRENELEDLKDRIAELEAEIAVAARDLRSLTRERDAAHRAVEQAGRRAEQARQRLDRAGGTAGTSGRNVGG